MLKNEEQIERIKNLILKSLLDEATELETIELEKWLARSVNNRRLFDKMSDYDYLESRSAEANFVAKNLSSKGSLSSKASVSVKSKGIFQRQVGNFLKVAAVVVLLVTLALFIMNKRNPKYYDLHATKVSVILGKGKPLVITDAADISKLAAKGLKVYGDTLDYGSATFPANSIHTLNVPKKRSFTVKLQDGSTIVLNSESSLKYAGNFAASKREVEIQGEAYFNVEKDFKNSFLVKTPYQDIMVTGTAFNVKAYSYEQTVKTTLVEGSVQIKYATLDNGEVKEELKPNEQFTLDTKSREVSKKEVDVNKYISWKDGIYFFESERLEEIMNNISRWYGLTVMFKSDTLKEIILSGKLRRDENPTRLIRTIGNLNSVEIIKSDNLLMIKEKKKIIN